MSESIVIDWAFASSVGAAGKDIDSFLAVRDSIRRAKARESGLDAALLECEKLGRWTQIFMVAELCDIVRNRPATAEATVAKRVLLQLLDGEEHDLRNTLASAVRDLAGGSDVREIAAGLDHAAARWLETEDPSDFSTRLDYSDIEIFTAPAMILGALLVIPSALENAASQYGEEGKSGLARLCAAALEGRYGRLTFVLALDLALTGSTLITANSAGDALAEIPREELGSAPDLLARLAQLELAADRKTIGSAALEPIAQELVTLRTYRAWFGEGTKRGAANAIALWHGTVISLMLDIEEAAATQILRKIWRPRIQRSDVTEVVAVPLREVSAGHASLLRLVHAPNDKSSRRLDIQANPSATIADTDVLLSPWLVERERLSAMQTSSERLRWLCGIAVAIRILETRLYDANLAPFVLHLLSAIASLRPYRKFSGPTDMRWQFPDQIRSGNLGWLARRLLISASETLNGDGHVALDPLVQLLEETGRSLAMFPDIGESDIDPDLRSSLIRKLATGALRLVENTLGTDRDSDEGGWLGVAERVVEFHAKCMAAGQDEAYLDHSADESSDDVILRGLISRYLIGSFGNERVVDRTILSAVQGESTADGSWAVKHRRLLLAPTTRARDWIGPGDEVGSPTFDVQLARALARVAAARGDASLDPEIDFRWHEELRQRIEAIVEPMAFDRFARMKLIDMIANGVFERHHSALMPAVAASIVFGGPVQIRALIRAVNRIEVKSEGAIQVRLAIYNGLARFLSENSEVPPSKRALLQQLKASSLFASRFDQRDIATYILGIAERDRAITQSKDPSESIRLSLDSEGCGRFFVKSFEDSTGWFSLHTAEMITLDLSSDRARALHRQSPIRGAVNSFARGAGLGSRMHIGVVELSYAGDRGGQQLEVRYAPDKLAKVLSFEAQKFSFGELVVLEGVSAESGTAARANQVHRFDRRARAIVDKIVEVTPVTDSEGQAQRLTFKLAGGRELDWARKTVNFVGIREVAQGYQIPVVGEVGGAPEALEPGKRDFSDLIIDHKPALDGSGRIILAIYEVGLQKDGKLAGLVVEARPLQLYRLEPKLCMSRRCVEALAHKIAAMEDQGISSRGLRVSLAIRAGELGPQLDLPIDDGQSVDALGKWNEASVFDDRNIWWRELFTISSVVSNDGDDRAQRQMSGAPWATKINRYLFQIDLGLASRPGLPQSIKAVLEDPSELGGGYVELARNSWNPWDVSISGSMETNALELPNGKTAGVQAVRELEALSVGSVVSLRRVSNTVHSDGRVYGYTPTNLRVRVNAETISMKLPCEPRQNWPARRKARLVYVEWTPMRVSPIVEASDIPAEMVQNGHARGYLAVIPVDTAGAVSCRVVWVHPERDEVLETDLRIEFPSRGRARIAILPGTRLEVRFEEGRTKERLFEPSLVADALWDRSDDAQASEVQGTYVGSGLLGDAAFEFYELGRGVFSIRKTIERRPSARNSLRRLFSLEEDYISATDAVRHYREDAFIGAMRRCALTIGSRNVTAAGVTSAELINAPVRLTGMQIYASEVAGETSFVLERHFQIQREQERGGYSASSSRKMPDARRQDDDKPLAIGDVLYGRYDTARGKLLLRGRQRRQFPDGLAIRPDRVCRAPLSRADRYPGEDAKAIIISTEPLLGSFVDVPPQTLDDLQRALQLATEDHLNQPLDPDRLRLIFAGRESVPGGDGGSQQHHFVFEWGYGLWAKLPASQLAYRESSIERTKFVLFFGDRISAAHVVENRLVIRGIAPSRGHELYRLRKDNRAPIVNLLRVSTADDGKPVLDAIEGLGSDERRTNAPLAVPHAQLDETTQLLLTRRLLEQSPQAILGRLDVDMFEESWGKDLVFRHVRMDLNDLDAGLKIGERTFVTAGEIEAKLNDVALHVHHPGLHRDDVGPAFAEGTESSHVVLRRAFSLREETLADILHTHGARGVAGDLLLVRLTDHGHSLIDGVLPRNPAVVGQQLRSGHQVLAIYGGPLGRDGDAAKKLRFELQPGVIVNLDRSSLIGSTTIVRGDLVRFKLAAGDQLAVELASPSDLRFVAPQRPAVLLPRQNLRQRSALPPYGEDQERKQRATGAFSVGDLPALTAAARARDERGRVVDISEAAFVSFMSQRHPKIGRVTLNDPQRPERGVHFIADLNGNVMVGAAQYTQARGGVAPTVRVVSLVDPIRQFLSDWYFLSYRDVSAVELEWLVSKAEWSFHDKETTVWSSGSKGQPKPVPQGVPPVSLGRGPIFFNMLAENSAVLRRRPADLLRYATGPGALVSPLSKLGEEERVDLVVAGSYSEGLFVELYPGRVIQLPGGVLCHQRHGVSVTLRDMDWELFGPGDQLLVSAVQRTDVLAPIELDVKWTHGGRNGFGPEGVVLEFNTEGSDGARGLAIYGVGSAKLNIPAQDIQKLPKIAVIGGPEHLAPLLSTGGRDLRHRTVLAVEGGEGSVVIHGLQRAALRPDNKWSWEDDPLMRGVMVRNEGNISFAVEGLLQIIRLAGGALPFTVEFATEDGNIVYVSRRYQLPRIRDDKIALGQVCGRIGLSECILINMGSRHFAVPASTLLPGVSDEDAACAMDALAGVSEGVWLRNVGGHLQSGYRDEQGAVAAVAPLCVAGRADQFVGVICVGLLDGKLRWLPANEAGACEMSFVDAKAAFAAPQLAKFQVAHRPNGDVSIRDHPRAKAELDRLRLGSNIFVDCLKDTNNARPFWDQAQIESSWKIALARSKDSSMIFVTAAPAVVIQRGTFQAEVAVRDEMRGRTNILLTVAGERRAVPDGPLWLFGHSDPPWIGNEGARFLNLSPLLENPELTVSMFASGTIVAPRWETLSQFVQDYIASQSVSLLLGLALSTVLERVRVDGGAGPVNALRRELIRNLFARSIRSIPLEHLSLWALARPAEVSPFTRIRYEQLSKLYGRGRLEDAKSAADRWLSSIAVEPVTAREEALANAMGVMIGVCRNELCLLREARFLPAVIAASRPVEMAALPRSITLDAATSELGAIGRSLLDAMYDIPLRPPIKSFKG